MKKHDRRSSLSAGGISQYIGVVLSITLLAHTTVICSAEPQKSRLARAWEVTKEYASKAAKRVGLDNPKEQARKRIQRYAGQAQASLKKFIACLEGKAGCSREDIRKVRLYTAIVITAITILAAVGYKVSQKPKDEEIEPAPKRRPIDEEEEGEEDPIKIIVRNANTGMWQSFAVTFDYFVERNPDLKIDWESDDGRAIAEKVHGFWKQLEDKTKFNLEKLGFPANADERKDFESMRSKEENLRIIKRNIDSLLDITSGRGNVDIQKAMIGLDRDDYQALKDFLEGPLSRWIHENWRTFDDRTKQALAKSAFILNKDERTDLARIEALQRKKEEEKRTEAEKGRRASAKKTKQPLLEAAPEEEAPPEPENPDGAPRTIEGNPPEPMEVEEPEPAPAEGWGAWIANWWNPPPNE